MTTEQNQSQQAQSSDEKAEKLRRVLSVKAPAAAQSRDKAAAQPVKQTPR